MAAYVVCALLAVLVSVDAACRYNDPNHTSCKYPQPNPSCNRLGSGVTDAQKADAVNAHNNFRQKVASGSEPGQPSASNMRAVKWDNELASVAQDLANQCKFEHDKVRFTSNQPCVGQNLAVTMSSAKDCKPDFNKAVKMWYDEVTKPGWNPADNSPFKFNYGAGHYTQVVWADTDTVGCGYTCYPEGGWYKQLYVCNYGVCGNMGRATMYKTGQPASQCPAGTKKSSSHSALCA